jgi:hypothetical protein
MEDVHGTHKQVPTGWVLWLKAVKALVAEDRRARDGAAGFGLGAHPPQPCTPH